MGSEIILQMQFAEDDQLEESIRKHVKVRLEAHAYPREIEFLKDMPRTKTEKILKQALRDIHETGQMKDKKESNRTRSIDIHLSRRHAS